jgi:hypothetical protein
MTELTIGQERITGLRDAVAEETIELDEVSAVRSDELSDEDFQYLVELKRHYLNQDRVKRLEELLAT